MRPGCETPVYLAHEDGAFVIGVPNAYAKDWLSMRLRPLITRTLSGIMGRAVDVTFVVRPDAARRIAQRRRWLLC